MKFYIRRKICKKKCIQKKIVGVWNYVLWGSLFKGHKGMHNQPTILQRLIQLKVTLAVLFLLFFSLFTHISLFT